MANECETYRLLLKRFVKLWEGHDAHYEAHYRAAAKHNRTVHHHSMMLLLDEVRDVLAEGDKGDDN